MAKAPNDKLTTVDTADAEVIKGTTDASSAEQPADQAGAAETTQEAGAGGPEEPSTEPASSLSSDTSSVDLVSSSGSQGTSLVDETEQFGATIVHTTVASVQNVTQDVELAMQRIRADVSYLHSLISNTAHYATLPIVDAERLVASIATHLGVVRKG
jgi:hypothetical protein